MRAPRLPAVLAVAAVVAGCGSAGGTPKLVSVRMAGGPPGASVSIDDQLVGTLDVIMARGIALPAGHHRVSVEAPGYFPWDRDIDAAPGPVPVRFDVRLEPLPD